MKLLFFTRALVCAPSARFDAAGRPQAAVRALRNAYVPRLRCIWSRDADGRLACRWLRDDTGADEAAIPLAAMRRFPAPVSPAPIHVPLRTPTQTRVTDFRRSGNAPASAPLSNDRTASCRTPGATEGTDHVRHVRPA